MARKRFKVNAVDGPVTGSGYTEDLFRASLEYLDYSTESETLNNIGTASLDVEITFLNGPTVAYLVQLPDGTKENEKKVFMFIGSSGSCAVQPAHFWQGTFISFDISKRYAELRWLSGKWCFVAGQATY